MDFFKLPVLVTCEFGNNVITYSKCCGVLFRDVLENMDSFKLVYLYIDTNHIGLALQE